MTPKRSPLAKSIDRVLRDAAFRNAEIAERAGTTTDQLSNWRYGKAAPSAKSLLGLAQGLESKADHLTALAAELRTMARRERGEGRRTSVQEALEAAPENQRPSDESVARLLAIADELESTDESIAAIANARLARIAARLQQLEAQMKGLEEAVDEKKQPKRGTARTPAKE